MAQCTVLAVDDDLITLDIVKDLLEDDGFEVVTAENGREALAAVMADTGKFDAIVMDRMMPEMGGLEVLTALRQNDKTEDIPVILQTSASSPKEMREGIDAGAYYYVTKPYDEKTLLAIVRSAVQNRARAREFSSIISSDMAIFEGATALEQGRFRISTMDQAKFFIWLVGQHANETAHVSAGLRELIANAIEHGNLGIGGNEKERLLRENAWDQEVERRLALPENAGKSVVATFDATGDDVVVTIEDEGEGFDWEPYINGDVSLENQVRGRGILSSKSMSFDSLAYEGGGRRAVATFAKA